MATEQCAQCGGSGWVITERDGVSSGRRCDCTRVGRPGIVWEQSGIPPNYLNDCFDNFSVPDANAHHVAQMCIRDRPLP